MNRDPKRAALVWTRVLLSLGEPGFAQVDPRERIMELAGRGGEPWPAAYQSPVAWSGG